MNAGILWLVAMVYGIWLVTGTCRAITIWYYKHFWVWIWCVLRFFKYFEQIGLTLGLEKLRRQTLVLSPSDVQYFPLTTHTSWWRTSMMVCDALTVSHSSQEPGRECVRHRGGNLVHLQAAHRPTHHRLPPSGQQRVLHPRKSLP